MNMEPELVAAIELAQNLGSEDLTGYIVVTISDENVQMALKLEDADLFAMWAHLGEVLLSGTPDKPGAMRAMVMALSLQGANVHASSQAPAGSAH